MIPDKLIACSLPAFIKWDALQARLDIQIDGSGRIGGVTTIVRPPINFEFNRTMIWILEEADIQSETDRFYFTRRDVFAGFDFACIILAIRVNRIGDGIIAR